MAVRNILETTRILLYTGSILFFVRIFLMERKKANIYKFIIVGALFTIYLCLVHPFINSLSIILWDRLLVDTFLDNMLSSICVLFLVFMVLTKNLHQSLYFASFICFFGVFSEDIVFYLNSFFSFPLADNILYGTTLKSLIGMLITILLLMSLGLSIRPTLSIKKNFTTSLVLILSANSGNLFSYSLYRFISNNIIIFNKSNNLYIVSFLITIAFCCFSLIWSNSLLYRITKQQEDNHFMEERLSDYKVQYHQQIAYMGKLNKNKHEFASKLLLISEYLTTDKKDELIIYLDDLLSENRHENQMIKTGNSAIDAVISETLSRAEKLDMVFDYDIEILDEIQINDSDILVLLGNICDNALESLERSKNILPEEMILSLSIVVAKGLFIIRSKNKFSHKIILAPKSKLVSSKQEDGHGIGLSIINEIVDKYCGRYEFFFSDNTFCSEVILVMDYSNL